MMKHSLLRTDVRRSIWGDLLPLEILQDIVLHRTLKNNANNANNDAHVIKIVARVGVRTYNFDLHF